VLLRVDDVDDLAVGAALLGSGGGGDAAAAASMTRAVLAAHGPVPVVAAGELGPDETVVAVAAIGATAVMVEVLPSGAEFVAAVRALEGHLHLRAAAVHVLEVGGVNALFAVASAAWLGLPVVDADGMGRAYPRLDQTTFAAAGVSAAPAALTSPSGETILITSADNAAVERVARAALPALGGWAAAASYPMPAPVAAGCGLPGSLSRALRLGRAWRAAQEGGGRPRLAALLDEHGGAAVFAGTVIDVRPRRRARPGVVTLEHRAERARTLRVEFADEYLLAMDDGTPVAAVPDIVCLLDARSWQPVSTDQLAAGQQLDLLRLPAARAWSAPADARLVCLEAFGLAPVPPEAGVPPGAPGP